MSLMSPSNTKKKTQRTSRIPSYTAVRGLDEVFVASDRSCICVRAFFFFHVGYKVRVLLQFWYVFQRFVFIFVFFTASSSFKEGLSITWRVEEEAGYTISEGPTAR